MYLKEQKCKYIILVVIAMCLCIDLPVKAAQSPQEVAGHLLSGPTQPKMLRLLPQTRGQQL